MVRSRRIGDAMSNRTTDETPASDPLVALNFLVHRDFRRRFKRRAVDADITQKELLHQALEAWEKMHRHNPEDRPHGTRP